MAKALLEREEMASTALDHGVAIMHPRRPQADIISDDFLTLAIARKPVPFGGGFANETDVFFLLCCQTDVSYLRTLGKLARTLKTPGFLDELRQCPDAEAVVDLFRKTEQELS
jgi:PTS system nitrogen regulatory IIA component